MMTKTVNIYPNGAITTLNPPIRSRVLGVTKSIAEIRKCIIARAIVDEVLPGGKTVRLDFSNYDKDNNPSAVQAAVSAAKANAKEEKIVLVDTVNPVGEKAKISVEQVKEEPKKEEPKVDYAKPEEAVEIKTDMDAAPVADIEPAETNDEGLELVDVDSL